MKADLNLKDFPEVAAIKDLLDKYLIRADKKTRIQTIVLLLIGAGLFSYIGAPALTAFSAIKVGMDNKNFKRKQIYKAVENLKRRGLVSDNVKRERGGSILITDKGRREIKYLNIDLINIPKSKKWDKKWRLVLFDIPIRFRKSREGLRWKLKELGFEQFQRSIWIYPFDCYGQIKQIAEFWGVDKHVKLILAEKVSDNESWVKKFSSLIS